MGGRGGRRVCGSEAYIAGGMVARVSSSAFREAVAAGILVCRKATIAAMVG
jgi:hypothetical protein